MSPDTRTIVQKHLAAALVGVDALMQDYTEQSVLITYDATYHGLGEIRRFFTALYENYPADLFDRFVMNRQDFVGECAYIHWHTKPWIPVATDTFLVRDGKILYQTFTALSAS